MPEPVIVDAVRTPIGRAFKGSLAHLRPDEMGAFIVDALLERNPDVDPALIEEVYAGVGLPQEQREALGAGIPFPSRLGTPEEYAELALHIVENTMLNGETIRLDGALRMPPK